MSSKILIKRSTTSGSVPTTSDLDTGELGLNTADKRVYTNNEGTIVELGTYPSSLNVTGNTDLDGTLNVDGASTLASGTVSGNWTVTGTLTVSTPTNSTDAASKGYVDTAVANVIDSAPAALDTLNELAAALNDDANFATTVTTALATKLPLAGGTMTGDITLGANKITSTATPATDDTLTRKGYVDGILGSATSAADSATAAATSATNAANSATSASGSATTATTQATAAASSASAASTSATNAASSATSSANSATAAATSATNAASSETAAASSESAAATSETNAATSASSASTSASTATTKASEAATSATNAATSATNAASSESAAATSATNASNSASAASTSASNAATSATAASNAQTAAESARDSALAAYDNFDDRYLGAKSSDPTLDNDGNALVAGALYFNTSSEVMKLYTGSAWVAAYVSAEGLVQSSGDTMTGNLSFGDNDKAIFGAGSDLQIYHDGSNSVIKEDGTGNLRIFAENFQLYSNADNATMMRGLHDGAVELYYDGAEKLSTTNTGIDVTGTVTADGLTVNAGASGNFGAVISSATSFSSDALRLQRNGVAAQGMNITAGGESVVFDSQNTGSGGLHSIFEFKSTDETTTKSVVKFDGKTNDISFYEDTGITPKFFWDASAESLGIGTSSVSAHYTGYTAIDLGASASLFGNKTTSDTNTTGITNNTYLNSGATSWLYKNTDEATRYTQSNGTHIWSNAASGTAGTAVTWSERMRIDSSGDLLVGKTSPNSTVVGAELSPNGYGIFTTSNNHGLLLNRTLSDGTIATFRKDGATVGSIGTSTSGGNFYIADDSGYGFSFDQGGAIIYPCNSSGNVINNTVDLGNSNFRFKDLYLSGGVQGSGSVSLVTGANANTVNADGSLYSLWSVRDNVMDLGRNVTRWKNLYLSGKITNNGTGGINIDTSGNVGIGTSSPLDTLHIHSGGIRIYDNTDGNGGVLAFGSASGYQTISGGSGSSNMYYRTYANHIWKTTTGASSTTDGTERMRIDSSGNLLVGTTSAVVAALTTAGSGNRLSPSGIVAQFASNNIATAAFNRTSTDGDVIQIRQNGSTKGTIDVTSSGVTYNTTSDRRLKDNITPITDGTGKLMAMNPVTHTWKADPDAPAVHGFIAQEMQDVVPEAVSGEDGGDEMMSMDYGRITPVLVAALQDAVREIESLKAEVAALKEK